MLPTSAGVEPVTSWSPVGRRIQLRHRGRPFFHVTASVAFFLWKSLIFPFMHVLPDQKKKKKKKKKKHAFVLYAYAHVRVRVCVWLDYYNRT